MAKTGVDAIKFQMHITAVESAPDEPWRIKFSPQDNTRFPYERWLRTTVKNNVHDILLDKRTLERGYLEKGTLEKMVTSHTRDGVYPKEIFSLITLELWHRAFLERNS